MGIFFSKISKKPLSYDKLDLDTFLGSKPYFCGILHHLQ
jgi:hypothetical protein